MYKYAVFPCLYLHFYLISDLAALDRPSHPLTTTDLVAEGQHQPFNVQNGGKFGL